jgi:phospholipase C
MAKNLANPNIKHVFVLMLENRSFDHMMGYLSYPGIDAKTGAPTTIEGVKAGTSNSYLGKPYPVSKDAVDIMTNDPGHEFLDVVEQLCGKTIYNGGPYPPIDNSGFVQNFATSGDVKPVADAAHFGDVMRCYDTAAKLPVLSALAQEFAVCDHWYSSLPGPTWPNRFFVHAASSSGLDHSPKAIETMEWETLHGFKFRNGTIFDLLEKQVTVPAGNKPWRLYRGRKAPLIGSIPCVAALKGIHLWDTHPYENFKADLGADYPYAYTFIEPNYGDYIMNEFSGGNSQHPRDDVQQGELLIKDTYEAIRQSPLWPNSLLIIAYDEHGGFFDHVAPPAAVAPGDTVPHSKYNRSGFGFEQYGVRVPALVISAYTRKSWISHETYDHASVPATLEAIFNMPALTKRDAAAFDVTSLASLAVARTDTPFSLDNVRAIAPVPVTAPVQAVAVPVPDDALRELENVTPIDGGNVPGFVHVVKKAALERQEQARLAPEFEAREGATPLLTEEFTTTIETRGEARQYLESTLSTFFE